MKYFYSFALSFICIVGFSQNLKIPTDTSYITSHSTKIKGQTVNYTAETGFQPVWNSDGEMTASLYYTYYKRTNDATGNKRPIIVSFNGGPGSASVWMHIAYTCLLYTSPSPRDA